MKQLLLIFFIAFSINSFSQDSLSKKQKDSVAALQKDYTRFQDSLLTKTSVQEFITFLYSNVLAKAYQEATFQQLLNFFVQRKGDEWLQKRNKPKQK